MNYPNGGRCMGCTHLLGDCSHLDFDSMKKVGKVDKQGDQVALCTNFTKSDTPWELSFKEHMEKKYENG